MAKAAGGWVLGLRGWVASCSQWFRAPTHGDRLVAGGAALTDFLFPPHCFLCGKELPGACGHFCSSCRRAILHSAAASCPRCARPVPPPTRASADGCLRCRKTRLHYQRTIALGIYGGSLRELVLRMKQARHEALSMAAGGLLADRLRAAFGEQRPSTVVPVPMHWWRRLFRGVNDAELLAETVARQLALPLYRNLVRCRRSTRKQGTLTPAERLINVRGAYRVNPRSNLRNQHVLVVDDVMTTGATANEIARVLRKQGAREVTVAVIARGVGFDR